MEEKKMLKDKVLEKVVGGFHEGVRYSVRFQCTQCGEIYPGMICDESELSSMIEYVGKKICSRCGGSCKYYDAREV